MFPWRETSNPFHLLIAEVLLQQTNVRKAGEVYTQLVSQYPTPSDFMKADIKHILSIVEPLGLRYRAGRLKKCAEIICTEFGGSVPDSIQDLKNLPGIGEYIANAVLCYAFDRPTVPIDTNVLRLFKRFFGYYSTKTRARTDKELAERIRKHYKHFGDTKIPNLAVLDFSAEVCTAYSPKCSECLLFNRCFEKVAV